MNHFSWKRILKIVGTIILICALVAGGYFAVISRSAKIAWASVIKDEHQHYLDCYELPFYPQVEKAFSEHADIVLKLKQAGAFEVQPHLIKCKGFNEGIEFIKGDIEIDYSTHAERLAIEKIIGDNFFGIPYRGHSR